MVPCSLQLDRTASWKLWACARVVWVRLIILALGVGGQEVALCSEWWWRLMCTSVGSPASNKVDCFLVFFFLPNGTYADSRITHEHLPLWVHLDAPAKELYLSIHKTNFAVIMLHVESATEFLDEQKRKKNCRWALEWSSTTHCLWRKWWFKQRLSTSFSNGNRHLNEPISKTLVVALARPTLKVWNLQTSIVCHCPENRGHDRTS